MMASGTDELRTLLCILRTLPEASDSSDHIERISLLEEVRSAAAAVQAAETAAFAAERQAEFAARTDAVSSNGVPSSARSRERDAVRDVAGQVGLARRISPNSAARYVQFATILTRELPGTYAVLMRGETTELRTRLVARHAVCLSREQRAHVDRTIAPRLAALGDRRTETEVRRLAYELDPRGYLERMAAAENDRGVGLRPTPECMTRLSALLPVAQGVACFSSLGREADSRRATGDQRSRRQIMADTLVQRVLGTVGAQSPDVPVEVNLVLSDETLLRNGDEPGWIEGYGPVPAGAARELALGRTARNTAPRWLRRLYLAPGGRTLAALESRRRLFTPAQRRFLQLRDQFCRTPHCEAPVRHADHVVPYAEGGATDVANGEGLCEACNHTKQVAGWRTEAGPDGAIDTITPTGRRYRSPLPAPPGARRRRRRPVVADLMWSAAA